MAIARKLGINRRTVQRLAKNGVADARSGLRPPRGSKLDPYATYLAERLAAYPELSAVRLLGELRAQGYTGGYTTVKDGARHLRPAVPRAIEQRYEVDPGNQAQVDFATFKTSFWTVYALLVVLSWSRVLWVRFAFQQDQLAVLGGLQAAFGAFGGVPRTVLFERMKTAVAGAGATGAAVFNAELLRFAGHAGFTPQACRPYRAKTKGRVERAVSYLRTSFFYGRAFSDLADLNAQCDEWLDATANARSAGGSAGMGSSPNRAPSTRCPRACPPRSSRSGRPSRSWRFGWLAGLVARHRLLPERGERQLAPAHRRSRAVPAVPEDREPAPPPLPIIAVEERPLAVYA